MSLPPALGNRLPAMARRAVCDHFGLRTEPLDLPAELQQLGACFVTVTREEQLRGCVGGLRPTDPLAAAVRRHAVSAATLDRRFPPLRAAELPEVLFEVTVLTELVPVDGADRALLLDLLRPGIDGLFIESGVRSATFLPQVWRQLPEPREFLDELLKKAGLPSGSWPDSMATWRYGAESWRED